MKRPLSRFRPIGPFSQSDRSEFSFPSVADIDSFDTRLPQRIDNDELKEAVRGFEEPDIIDSQGKSPFGKWELPQAQNSGVTGLHFPEDNLSVIEPRSSNIGMTHKGMLDRLSKEVGISDQPFFTYASVNRTAGLLKDEGWFIDINSSGGSLTRIPDLTKDQVDPTPRDMWGPVFAAYLTDHPFRTIVTFNYTFFEEDRQDVFDIGAAYKMLKLELMGLPEPEVERL